MRSLSSEYHTTIEILTNKEKFLKIRKSFQNAKTTETKPAEPEIPTKLEVANSTTIPSVKQAKVCWVRKGNHLKPPHLQWLKANERMDSKNFKLMWHELKNPEKRTTNFTNAAILNYDSYHFKQLHSSDSESKCERSNDFCATISANVKGN